MRRISYFIVFLALLAFATACASNHSTYQKRKKKKCDCPSWSENSIQNTDIQSADPQSV